LNIRTRITVQFSIIVSIIVIAFSIITYLLLSKSRHEESINRIKDKALTYVKLYSDVDEVDKYMLNLINKNSVNVLPEERIFIYNFDYELVYSNSENSKEKINRDTLKRIVSDGEIEYVINNEETVGFVFAGKKENFIVVASAYDKTGHEKLIYLRKLFIVRFIISIALVVIIGLFFSKQALSPLTEIVKQIDRITATNLNLRLSEGNGKDEISQLALKFNKMLERLDQAFEIQRSFVSNASHELRTPLTSLTGQLEVALMKENTNDPREVMNTLLAEIKQLNKLANGLLDLAQTNLDVSDIKLTTIRIDELIGSARAEIIKRNKEYKVNLNIDEFPDEHYLTLKANEQLLRTAIVNLVENACKYSEDHTAEIVLKFDTINVTISISDNGIGILETDIEKIYDPFFRSANTKNYKGHGIGLTLAKKIIELHRGRISIRSILSKGTDVMIVIPHI
jgi:signal transduction histidine kinase